MKKTLSAVAASALLSVAGLASAAEPMQLDDSQMDSVSAGATSVAAGLATALFGTVVSDSNSGTEVVLTPISVTATTYAGSFNLATGLLVSATSQAGAEL